MQPQPRLPLWFLVANWALILVAFVLGVFLGGNRRAELPQPQGTAFELVYDEILRHHVEPQDGRVLLDRAIGAMAGKLDEYSMYVPPGEVARYDEDSTGRYEGVGMRQVVHGDDVVVYYPFPGGPAERAGIRPGDRLIAIDGQRIADLPKESRDERTVELVRGPAGTDVRLRLLRDAEEVEFVVRRGPVQQPSVKWAHLADAADGLGYVYITDFHVGMTGEVHAAIASLREQGPLRGLVVDLRFDGGGSLDECVALARTFQPRGTIVSTRRRNEVLETHEAKAELCRYADLPMVVLVNEHSASASEVFAGCLQDHGRAAIVGARTYGKGVVNTVYSWKDLPFRLKLTTAHYYTPNGRNIERRSLGRAKNGNGSPATGAADQDAGGILPDVLVPADEAQRKALAASLHAYEVPRAHLPAFAAVAARYGVQVPAPPRPADDPQLQRALETLRKRVADAAKGK